MFLILGLGCKINKYRLNIILYFDKIVHNIGMEYYIVIRTLYAGSPHIPYLKSRAICENLRGCGVKHFCLRHNIKKIGNDTAKLEIQECPCNGAHHDY